MSPPVRRVSIATPRDEVPLDSLARSSRAALFLLCLATLFASGNSRAASQTGAASGTAGLDFRIVIPAVVRATIIVQPDAILIEDRHISKGYIDLKGETSIRLTSNSRAGYVLAAAYDTQLLARIDVQVSSQNLVASSGFGTMRVTSGLATNKVVPISYRLYLLPGVQKGSYRWPVALSFSPIAV